MPDSGVPDKSIPDAPMSDMPGTVPENTKARCQDKKDNDGDGFVDCKDQDCQLFVFCVPDIGIPDKMQPDKQPLDLPKPDLPVKNPCGGYVVLSPVLGTPCGTCGVLVCNGLNATKCSQAPEMVPIGKSCIDAYEGSAWSNPGCKGIQYGVGKNDYPSGFSYVVESKGISGKNYKPQTTPVYACSKKGVLPSASLSYYQAKRACENAGKRICTDAEIVAACKGPKNQNYPYGNSYQSGTCNDMAASYKKPLQTAQLSKCVGGYPGIYDISGNVYETAMGTAGAASCKWRGGSYNHISNYSSCSGATFGCTPWKASPAVGFRCCRDSTGSANTDGAMTFDQHVPQKDASIPIKDSFAPVQDTIKPDTLSPCGSITSFGVCVGTYAKYCDVSSKPAKVISYDCSKVNANCGILNSNTGVGCIQKNPCGKETSKGRCDGNTLVYCAVDHSASKVVKIPCGTYKCNPTGASNGGAACVSSCTPYSTWCIGTTYKATCSGTGAISYIDCVSKNGYCQQGGSGASCVPFSISSKILYGKVTFSSRSPTATGYSSVVYYPARNILVGIRKIGAKTWDVLAYTNDKGEYKITLPKTTANTFYVDVMPWRVASDGSILQVLSSTGSLYLGYKSHTMSGSIDKCDIQIDEPLGTAFSVYDDSWASLSTAVKYSGNANRSMNVYWEKNVDWKCGSCFYSTDPYKPLDSAIRLSGGATHQSHYDTSVIAHEIGHYVVYLYSKDDSFGGPHYIGKPISPPFAWSEGIATAFAASWQGSPFFIDGNSSGWWWVNLSKATYSHGSLTPPSLSSGIYQYLDEMVVASMIWSTTESNSSVTGSLNIGFKKTWDVATTYLVKKDRGWWGVDFVDFVDGLLCKGYITVGQAAVLYNGSYKFPYDFLGPKSCP